MNDEKFDESMPIIDEDGLENIGIALTAGTSFSIATQFTSASLIRDMTTDGSKIYIMGRIGSSGSLQNIRRYTLSGTYESDGNVTVPNPPRPSGVPSTSNFDGLYGPAYYNNNFYFIAYWLFIDTRTGSVQIHQTLERYNTSFVHQQHVTLVGIPPGASVESFSIYSNRIYVKYTDNTTVLEIRNLSDGNLSAGTNSVSLVAEGSGGGIAVTSTRIYVASGNSIVAYNHMLARVTADDTTLASGVTGLDMTNSGSDIYVIGRTGSRGSYSFSVYPYTSPNISWGPVTYTESTRAITAVLTVTTNPGSAFSATDDFAVQRQSGATWVSASNWTITSSGTGLTRTITATPAATVNPGTYRIQLKEDAFGTDMPSADLFTVGEPIAAINYTASWGTVSYAPLTRAITSVLTLSENPGSGFSESADFQVDLKSGSTYSASAGWTITSSGSSTARTITATPSRTVSNGTYRLTLKQNAFGTGKPRLNVSTSDRAIGSFYSATWPDQAPALASDGSISMTLTLSEDPGSAFSATNDFSVQQLSGSTWSTVSGWTLSSTGTGLTRTIKAAPPSGRPSGVYRILLAEDAFGSDKPPAPTPSPSFDTGSSSRTITVPIPQSSVGAIQIALKARSFNVLENTSQVGPDFQQYLGTVYYDTGGGVDVIPSIAIGGGSFCTTSRRVTWTAYVTDASETELTNFTVADVSVNNVTSSGASITPTVTVTRMPATGSSFQIQTDPIPTGRAGDISVTVVANALGPDTNKSVTSGCVSYDTRPVAPTPIIATWQYANYCSTSDRVYAALRFNKAITNLDVRSPSLDIQVANDRQNANLTGWTLSFSGHTGSGQTAALAANTNLVIEATPPANTNLDVYLHVNMNSVTSGTQTGPDSMVYSETIPVNNVPVTPPDEPPSITIDGGSYCTTSRRVTWTAYVTGATDTELDAFTNADTTINNVTSAGTSFTPTETVTRMPAGGSSFQIQTDPLPVDKAGDMSVTVAANALGANTNKSVTSSCVFYDTRPAGTPTVATARWGTPATQTGINAVLQGRLTFTTTTDVRGIEPGDFDVIFRDSENPPNVHVHPPAGWTIQVSHSFTNSSRDFVDVTATPTSTFDAAFGLRLKATSVRSDGATMDNAPSPDPVDSVSIEFDNRETAAPSVPQVVIGAGGFCPTSRKLTWPVSVVNASATQFAALLVDDVSITDSSMATPALTAAVVSRGSNSLIVEIEVPTERNGTASISIAANALGSMTNTAVTSNTVSYDTRTTVSSTTITYGTPVVSNTDRDIEFPMTFTDIGDGLEASDFSISATNGVWGATLRDGTGGVQTKVLVVNNAEVFARMGTLQVTLVEDAFINRTITGGRTSPEASYDLESTITETTVTFSNANVSNNNRTITYTLTFSNIGAGLNTCDFSVSATNGRWNLIFEYLGNHQVLVTIANSETVRRSGSLTITISENAFFNRVITGGRTSRSATYNFLASTAPRLTFSTYTTSTIRHGQRFTVFCNWSQSVTGFTERDLSIWDSYGGRRIEEESFIGSGRAYQFVVTAPPSGDRMFISVRQGAVSPSNFPANYEIRLGGGEVTPTILNANIISGDGMTYMPNDLYTISQSDMERPTIRTYNHNGSLRTTEQVTLGGLLENEAGQGHAIEVLDNRFVISTNRFDRFGITRASGYIEDSTTFNNLFIDVGQYNPHTSPPIPTDTAIRDLAVGGNRIFALTSDGTFESPSYEIHIFDLLGNDIRSITVDTTTQNTKELFGVPNAIAATSRFLYLAFRTFRNPLDGTITVADELQAYTLEGDREPSEDVKIADFMGVANRFSIISMDWDETRQRMWLIVDQIRIATDEAQRHFAYLPMPQRIDAAWSAIEPQTMRAGESLDLKPYAGDITQILFAPQSTVPDWVTLSNGVMSIASTGLPSTNTEALMSFVGISSGKPAFVSFDLTLLRESPSWSDI